MFKQQQMVKIRLFDLEGDVFEDVMRFKTKKEAVAKIKELLK